MKGTIIKLSTRKLYDEVDRYITALMKLCVADYETKLITKILAFEVA